MEDYGKDRKKLQLIQMIAVDTPANPQDIGFRFCILLLRFFDEKAGNLRPAKGFFETSGAFDAHEALVDALLADMGLNSIAVPYDGEIVVLLYGTAPAFSDGYRERIEAFLSRLERESPCRFSYVVSPVASGSNLIHRIYRMTKTELEQRLFRKEAPAVFLEPEREHGEEEPLSQKSKDAERRLFLKLINLDFDGAALCAEELLSTVGIAGNSDVSLMKLRLFCILENAAYFLAFRAGKDQAMSDVTPRYLGDFLSAVDSDYLLQRTLEFISLLEQEFSPSDTSVSLLMNKMLGYFSDHYMDPGLTVQSAAEHFHISPQQLSRDFKKMVGMSPAVYLMQIRVDRARQLLLDTTMSNEQIASHVGFGNVKRLYRAIQAAEGVSPGQFRRTRGGGE